MFKYLKTATWFEKITSKLYKRSKWISGSKDTKVNIRLFGSIFFNYQIVTLYNMFFRLEIMVCLLQIMVCLLQIMVCLLEKIASSLEVMVCRLTTTMYP